MALTEVNNFTPYSADAGAAGDFSWVPADAPTPGNLLVMTIESRGVSGERLTYQPEVFGVWDTASYDYASDELIAFVACMVVPDGPFDANWWDLSVTAGTAGASTVVRAVCQEFSDGEAFLDQVHLTADALTNEVSTNSWTTGYGNDENPDHINFVGVAVSRELLGGAPTVVLGLDGGITHSYANTDNIGATSGQMKHPFYPDDSNYPEATATLDNAFNAFMVAIIAAETVLPLPPLIPAPDPGVDTGLPVNVVQVASFTQRGEDFTGSVTFEPYTPSTGSLYVVAIEVEQATGNVEFDQPDFIPDVDDANAFAGWGKKLLVESDGRMVQVFYGPVQDVEGYLTFPALDPAQIHDDAAIRARLYEFESELGPVLGYYNVEDLVIFNDSDVDVDGSPWIASPTGYDKDGVTIALAFRSSAQSEAVFTESLNDMHFRSGPFGSYSRLGYGQTPMNATEALSLPADGNGDYHRGLWCLRVVVPQSRYRLVQEENAVGSPSVSFDAPAAGNLLIVNVRSTAPVSFGSEWNVEEVVRSDSGLRLTTAWRAATADDITGLTVTGATDIGFIEASGFTGAPSLLKSVRLDTSVGEDDPGYNPALHGGMTTMPFSVPDNDALFFAARSFDQPANASFLLPEFGVQLGARSLRAEADGWDFYPDMGMPVMILGFEDTPQPGGVVGFGALFIDSGEEPPPPTPGSRAMFTCPKSVRACAVRLTKLNSSGVPLDPLTPFARVQTSAFAELSINPDIESGSEVVVRANGGDSIAIVDRSCDILKGLELNLKLCGIPHPVLDLLLGVEAILDEDDDQVGATLPDGYGGDCIAPVMLELWSRNLGDTTKGRWIHWLIPRSFKWSLSGSLSFSNGPLEVELNGYAEQNPAWYPSFPAADGFKAYVPGAGDADGWPLGAPGGVVLPDGIQADPWSLADMDLIRRSGPLAWRVVDSLPEPLDDCDYIDTGADCSSVDFSADFCGTAGSPLPEPWAMDPPLPPGLVQPLVVNGSCAVQPNPDSFGYAAVPIDASCCEGGCATFTASGQKQIVELDGGTMFLTPACYFSLGDASTVVSLSIQGGNGDDAPAGVTLSLQAYNLATAFPLAAALRNIVIPDADFNAERWQIELSWCTSGDFNYRFTTGGTVITGSVVNALEMLGAASIDHAGFFFAQDESSGLDTFNVNCGSLPDGDPVVLLDFDCLAGDHSEAFGFCGEPGSPLPSPWEAIPQIAGMDCVLPEFSGFDDCRIYPASGERLVASVPTELVACCEGMGVIASVRGDKSIIDNEGVSSWTTPAVGFTIGTDFFVGAVASGGFDGTTHRIAVVGIVIDQATGDNVAVAYQDMIVDEASWEFGNYGIAMNWTPGEPTASVQVISGSTIILRELGNLDDYIPVDTYPDYGGFVGGSIEETPTPWSPVTAFAMECSPTFEGAEIVPLLPLEGP